MTELAFRVHGVDVLLNADDESFVDYVNKNLASFRVDSIAGADLRVNYTFRRGESHEFSPEKDMQRIGRNIWQGSESVLFRSRGLEVLVHLVEGGTLEIDSHFHLRDPPISWPRRLVRRIRGKDRMDLRKNEISHFAARMAFHLPLFWLLAEKGGLSLIHGSSVCVDGRALIFAGLNNSGKSTLAASLSVERGWPQMSDNFTLVNDRSVFAYPESQRISMDMISSLQLAEGGRPAYGKLHVPPGGEVPLEAEVQGIYFLSFGQSASIRIIEPDEALRKMHAIHDYISEFPEYSYLRFLGDWDRGNAESRLRGLFSRSRLYALTQSMQPDLRETHRLIEETLCNVK